MMNTSEVLHWIRTSIDKVFVGESRYAWLSSRENLVRYPTIDMHYQSLHVDPFACFPQVGFFQGHLEIYADENHARSAQQLAQDIAFRLTLDPVDIELDHGVVGMSFECGHASHVEDGCNQRYPKLIKIPLNIYIHYSKEAEDAA